MNKKVILATLVVGLVAGSCAGEQEGVKQLDKFDGKGDNTKTSKVLDGQKKDRENALKGLDDEASKN